MIIVRTIIRHAAYYVLIMLVASIFSGVLINNTILNCCKAAIAISMFANIYALLCGGKSGVVAQGISAWCLRSVVIVAVVFIASGIGLRAIADFFKAL